MIMDSLVRGFSASVFDQNPVDGFKHIDRAYMDPPYRSINSPDAATSPSSDGDASEESDPSDATLRLINQMLMEEDELEHKPCMFQQCLALQATEKSFYDALGEEYPSYRNQHHLFDLSPSSDDNSCRTFSSQSSSSPTSINNFIEPAWGFRDQEALESSDRDEHTFESILESISSSNGSGVGPFQVPYLPNHSQPLLGGNKKVTELVSNREYANLDLENNERTSRAEAEAEAEAEKNKRDHSPNGSSEKKTRDRENGDYEDPGRSSKQLADSSTFAELSDEELELFDKVLLCPALNPHLHEDGGSCLLEHDNGSEKKMLQNGSPKGSNGGKSRGKKQGNKKEVVDLRTLLSQCAQAVARADMRNANELLNRIRQHSSPHGDGNERMAHYFANALEARLAGTGTPMYTSYLTKGISAADVVKGYQTYVQACPFNKMSNMFANKSIGKLAHKASRLHIIDFGIMYGFQWPCLIQRLSVRASGPPKIHITGIDFPQPGFRPAQRVEETGHRLATYCQRFDVPFEYTAIAKKWETITLEELKIDKEEVLVVNCLCRLKNVPDETVVPSCPRDAVLNLVKRTNPDMFIHGVLNGSYNAPFFVTRFREAAFHFSSLFDMFDATIPREDNKRMMFEREVYGREIMNVVACEGTERVERPETYKQWQSRTRRAGFRQLPLNQEILKDVRSVIKVHYHKDFMVDEDANWMLQGWKGRIMIALSCWKPNKET